ncbi:MAG: hypothetical protein ABIJ21_00425 [Nanoarchaeota archaeon]
MPPPMFSPFTFTTELVFTIIAVIFCALIYFKTKDIYDLTKYKGIKYFRNAFLYFGLSYIIRFLFSLFMLSMIAFDVFIPRYRIMPFFILILGYFSTAGILYLVFSSLWKKIKAPLIAIFIHGTAIILSLASFFTRSHIILIYLQTALLVFAVVLSILTHKAKRISGVRILYFLIFALWLINLWILDRGRVFSFEIKISFQFISLVVFFTIYHKITKWVT